MGRGPARGMGATDPFTVDGVEFVSAWDRPSVPGSLTLLKSARMVDRYRDLLAAHPHPRLVELGISQGGSVALLALLARPTRFVAVDLSEEPIAPLLAVLAEHGLEDTVRPYFGVDQADRVRLAGIVADEMGDAPLDLVVDDASHLFGPTLASFEVLFPLLRPGGTYVIEDWTWQDVMSGAIGAALDDEDHPLHAQLMEQLVAHLERGGTKESPISRLALEAVLAQAQSPGVIAGVSVDEDWITIRRGDVPVDPEGFTLGSLYTDHYGVLAP